MNEAQFNTKLIKMTNYVMIILNLLAIITIITIIANNTHHPHIFICIPTMLLNFVLIAVHTLATIYAKYISGEEKFAPASVESPNELNISDDQLIVNPQAA